ncbi:MAG: hypothetical protein NC342_02995 [Pseudoflavonifractor sp.]|nr:hypothetical protein [Alloprevotella sp.]MCM1116480.1 hypothetical protein [Pseudoflavonifractor sp.]
MTLLWGSCQSYDSESDLPVICPGGDGRYSQALVTVIPSSDGSIVMRLDDDNTLVPSNPLPPYEGREARAVLTYPLRVDITRAVEKIEVIALDTIRTLPVASGLDGGQPAGMHERAIEISSVFPSAMWDGYLTLSVAVETSGSETSPRGLTYILTPPEARGDGMRLRCFSETEGEGKSVALDTIAFCLRPYASLYDGCNEMTIIYRSSPSTDSSSDPSGWSQLTFPIMPGSF